MLAASDSLAAAVSATGATSGVSKVNNKTPTPLSSINVGPPLPAGSLQGQSGSGGKAGSGGQQKKQGQDKKSSKSPGPVPAFAAAAAAGAASLASRGPRTGLSGKGRRPTTLTRPSST